MSDETVQKGPETKVDSSTPSAAAPPPATAVPPAPPVVKSQLSGEVVFNEDTTIYSGTRIPHYDKGPVKAYAARSTKHAGNLFALICEDHLTPRTLKAGNYASIINQSLPRLVASGVAHWTPSGKEKYCFIYENTLGNPLMKDDLRGGMGMKPEHVMSAVIRPIISVLADMRDKDIVHGNIRASNIFDGGVRNFERAVLGECLALPVSCHQPVLYEPIDRSLSSALGRGTGMPQDDLYSFGVSLAMLLRHHDPLEDAGDEEIIGRKMEEGTYSVLLGKDRLSGAILELMRGLLYDDENQRWTLDEVLVWLDGRRLSPKQTSRRAKAARPLLFNNEKYIRPELLARDLFKNVTEARQVIESGDMEQWLSRALEDKVATARFEKALQLSQEGEKGSGFAERLVSRVAIALHPEGPLRYKSIASSPDGVGVSLTEAYIMKRDLQTYVDFFMNYFITQWIDAQTSAVPDVSSLISKFDGARAYLRNKSLGAGLEKCLYSLNTELHCLSEKIAKFYVRTPEDLMRAYEKMSRMPGRPVMFMDRHIAAFLSVKDRKNIDPYLHDLNMPEPYRRILAEARVLATIQKRSNMEKFPGIAAWIVDNLDPVYERFHDRLLRVEIKKKVAQIQESGDLAKLVFLFDNPEIYQEDNNNFRRSMRKYHDLERESLEIEKELRDEATLGQDTGRQIAAVVAGILAAIIILATMFSAFGGHKGF